MLICAHLLNLRELSFVGRRVTRISQSDLRFKEWNKDLLFVKKCCRKGAEMEFFFNPEYI